MPLITVAFNMLLRPKVRCSSSSCSIDALQVGCELRGRQHIGLKSWHALSEACRGRRLTVLAALLSASMGLTAVGQQQQSQQQPENSPLLYSPTPDTQSQMGGSSNPSTGMSPSLRPTPGVDASGMPNNSVISPAATSDAPLSADQIRTILQQNPEAMVEVKQLVSDQASQSGKQVPADSISDDELMAHIDESPELRSNISVFLRSRGYAPDSDENTSDDDSADKSNSSGKTAEAAKKDASNPASAKSKRTEGPMQEPTVLHRKTPYNLLALHDLYTQVQDTNGPLKRFGADVFTQREADGASAMTAVTNPDIQAGASYVLGPGDSLSIQMWGALSQSITRSIDREGQLALPEAGVLPIAGMTLEHAQQVIVEALRHQFRNVEAAVTIARLRSIRVYVVGDVQRPGAYELGALATPINALYSAGGPTAVGSLRILRHYRGPRLIGEIDLYDFLLHGIQSEDRLQSGDTLLVPPTGPQVAISGAVKRPAIYELKGKTSLEDLLENAGAARVTAALGHITLDRVQANQHRETIPVNVPADSTLEAAASIFSSFMVQDGDKIRVSPIEPYSERVIYTEGHLLRPGRMAYHDGMQLSDVLKSYRDLLPEPADRGEIVRLVAPDLHVDVIAFNVEDLMIGNSNLALQPFDTIRIHGRYEADAPKVRIGGEVLRPGVYSLSKGMTAGQLVRIAGGFTRSALQTDADLTSYRIVNGTRVEGQRVMLPIGEAVAHEGGAADVPLKAGDTLNVHRLTGWDDIGASIQIEGEVAHPGRYGFQQGEHLSAVLLRAGGFRDSSYPAGAVLTRPEVKQLEEKSKEELIRQIEISSSAARIAPSLAPGDAVAQAQLVQAQQQQILASLKSRPATGRLVLHIDSDIASWANTPADIEVRAGDVLRIPKRPGFVLVNGQVYNGTAITFTPGKSAEWYLRRAGGPTEVANRKEIFVIRANGSVVGRENGTLFHHDVLGTRLDPGDVVVVPQKIIGGSLFWRNLLTIAQITSSITITAAVAGVL